MAMKIDLVDIISEEIKQLFRTNYTINLDLQAIGTYQYDIHCSQFISEQIYKAFLMKGFVIPSPHGEGKFITDENIEEFKNMIIRYQIPNLGIIRIIKDVESGYRIEKSTE